MFTLNREDLAWAAGLFEGEGSIVKGKRGEGGGQNRSPRLALSMTDEDIVRRFAGIVDCGTISLYQPPFENRKLQYKWSCSRFEHVQAIVAVFWPWLGERRRAKAHEDFTEGHRFWMARYHATHCKRGHPLDEANTARQANGQWRLCRTCHRESVRRYAARQRAHSGVPVLMGDAEM